MPQDNLKSVLLERAWALKCLKQLWKQVMDGCRAEGMSKPHLHKAAQHAVAVVDRLTGRIRAGSAGWCRPRFIESHLASLQ